MTESGNVNKKHSGIGVAYGITGLILLLVFVYTMAKGGSISVDGTWLDKIMGYLGVASFVAFFVITVIANIAAGKRKKEYLKSQVAELNKPDTETPDPRKYLENLDETTRQRILELERAEKRLDPIHIAAIIGGAVIIIVFICAFISFKTAGNVLTLFGIISLCIACGGLVLLFVPMIVYAIIYWNKDYKLNSDDAIEGDGIIHSVFCTASGSSGISYTNIYEIKVYVQAVNALLRAKAKIFDKEKSYKPGQKVKILYNHSKPKYCIILEDKK